jgi:hypothetical protein
MFIDDKLNGIAEAYKKMKMKAEAEDPAAKPVGGDQAEDEKKDDVEEACGRKGKKEALDPVGKADADVDNDGDVDDSDEYLANRRKAIKKSMKKESVELTEASTRDYVDNIMPRALKKAGIECKVSKKAGYTSYKYGDYEIVNDGVGIKVKENGKEVAYYSKPKLDYKKAVEKINEEVEQLEEFMKFDAKDAIKDFSGEVAKIASAQKVTAKVMPVRGNSFDTDNGYVPVLKNFTRKGKTATVDLKAGDEVAIDTKRGNVYGMVGDKFFYTSTGNVDLKEGVEVVVEAKFNKGDSVKIKNVRKYDALAKDDEGTVVGMMGSKVMVKVGTGQMNVDPKDLILESSELSEGKKLRNVLSDKEFEKSMKKALADKGNYKGGKVNWNFIDADVYMELSAKGYDLRHPSINYMDRFDKLADKLDPEMNESVEQIDEVTFTIPKSKAGADYMSRKAKERQDQHKKQDPKHAKTHARNMVDIDKAEKKAAKKGVKMRDYGKDAWKVRNGVKRGKLPENAGYKSETLKNLVSDLSEAKVSMDAVADIMANAKRPEDAVKMIVKKFKVSAKEAEKLMAKALGE